MAPPPLSSHLSPWLNTLRALRPVTALSVSSPPPSPRARRRSSVWLQFPLPADVSTSHSTRWIEALELFVLLAWADVDAWKALAEEQCTAGDSLSARDWTMLVLEPQEPPRVIGYEIVCTRAGDARAFCEYLTGQDEHVDQASDYRYVRGMLEAAAQECGDAGENIPVRLRLKPRNPRQTYDEGTLSAITSLAALQQELPGMASNEARVSHCRLASFRSRIVELHDDLCVATSVDDVLLREMTTIWSHGVRVVNLPQLRLKLQRRTRMFYVNALQSLLGVGREGCVKRVIVTRPHPPTVAVPLLSAVASSASVQEVLFSFEQLGTSTSALSATQWMAYALLSAHVNNNVAKVALRCRFLDMDHVTCMRDVLTAADPISVLFSDYAQTIQLHRRLFVSATRVFLENPTVECRQLHAETSLLEDKRFTNMRVLEHIDGWWIVFLPGSGRAWVNEKDAVVSQEQEPVSETEDTSGPKIRPLQELELSSVQVENRAAVLALLRLINGGVLVLRLVDASGAVDGMSGDVFDACPNLQELELREVFPDQLAFSAQCFGGGQCRSLKRLRINIGLLPEAALREICHILDLLADPNHPMAQQLETFEVDAFCMVNGNEAVDSNVLDTALRMLQSNKILSRLKLHLALAATDKAAVQRVAAELSKHHNVLLPTPEEPLGWRQKTSFLSVVWSKTSGLDSAMQQLDRRVISMIFNFVPDRRLRLIDIAMPEPLDEDD